MRRLLFMILILVHGLACTTRQVTPTRESRRIIDTTYTQRVLSLQPVMDSVCKTYGDSVYHAAVDSMLRERMDEMKALVK